MYTVYLQTHERPQIYLHLHTMSTLTGSSETSSSA